ncbi:MAG: BatD family protein [Pseudomonadota bacterium]|nr:BatD family protein [Pseudomonadota bacterium]
MKLIKGLIIGLLFAWTMTGLAVAVATVDRDELKPTDALVLTISITDTTTAVPDLSVLANDFQIFSSGQRTSIEMINGQMRQFMSWQIAMSPKRSGTLTIPAIVVGHDKTKPILIKVTGNMTAVKSTTDFFIETEITPKTAYVQQQLIYTQRVWCGRNLRNGELAPLSVQGKASIERFGEDLQSMRVRSGRNYQVVERRYMVFPQESGNLTLEAPVLRALTFDRNAASLWAQQAPQQIEVTGKALQLTVKPQPADFTGATWLPAEQIKLTEEWSATANAHVGEPITRTVTLQAHGLKAQQLPELSFDYPSGVNNYPDKSVMTTKVENNQVVGTRQFKVALIPTQPGSITLNAIKLPWFNTKTGKTEIANLPAKTVTILPSANASPAPTNDVKPTPKIITPVPQPVTQSTDKLWQGLGLAFAGLWLITLVILLWVMRRRKNTLLPQQSKQSKPSLSKTQRALKNACKSNDAKATQQAVLAWAEARWPNQGIVTLEQVATELNNADLQKAVHELLTACYRSSAKPWQGKSFWQAWERAVAENKHKPQEEDELPSLYS